MKFNKSAFTPFHRERSGHRLKDRTGFTIEESLITIVIILLIITSGMVFNEPLRNHIRQLERRSTAVSLACSQVEDLKEIAYTQPPLGQGWDDPLLVTGTNWHAPTIVINAVEYPGYTVTYNVVDKFDWPEDDTSPGVDAVGASGLPVAEYKVITVRCVYPVGAVGSASSATLQLRSFLTQKNQ